MLLDDAANADRGPERQQPAACVHSASGCELVGPRQQVDHPAEQHRIEELQSRNHQVGDGQQRRDPQIAPKKAEHTSVNLEESASKLSRRDCLQEQQIAHLCVSNRAAMCCLGDGSTVCVQVAP